MLWCLVGVVFTAKTTTDAKFCLMDELESQPTETGPDICRSSSEDLWRNPWKQSVLNVGKNINYHPSLFEVTILIFLLLTSFLKRNVLHINWISRVQSNMFSTGKTKWQNNDLSFEQTVDFDHHSLLARLEATKSNKLKSKVADLRLSFHQKTLMFLSTPMKKLKNT